MISIMLFVCLHTFCTTYTVCVFINKFFQASFWEKFKLFILPPKSNNFFHQVRQRIIIIRPYSRQRAPRSRNYTLSVDLSLHSILILSAFLLYFVLRFSGFPAPNLNCTKTTQDNQFKLLFAKSIQAHSIIVILILATFIYTSPVY